MNIGGHGFRFYAKENSELILHNYIYYYGNYESTISWKEQSQGFYVMVSENQMIADFDLDGRLERADRSTRAERGGTGITTGTASHFCTLFVCRHKNNKSEPFPNQEKVRIY